MNSIPLRNKYKPWLLATVFAVTAIGGAITYICFLGSDSSPAERESAEPVPTALPGVSALGRLEPMGEIINIAAPLALDGDRVSELLVQLGDIVQAGDPIAILDSRDRLKDDVTQAELQVRLAGAKLAQVQSGAKPGAVAAQEAVVAQEVAELVGQLKIQRSEIARIKAQVAGDRTAQMAVINRLKAELRNAEGELTRYRVLHNAGAISSSLYDAKRLDVDTARQAQIEAEAVLAQTNATAERRHQEAYAELARLNDTGQAQVESARASLAEVAEVRTVDIQFAEVELTAAKAALVEAQNNLEIATIKAPRDGEIINIQTRAGEQISSRGIVALGQTQQMLAVAEVYQSDIVRVKLGQSATVRGQAFSGELQGQVIEIGRQVSQQNVFSTQPGENLDRRVIEVKIALTPGDSEQVAGLSNLQVQTVINTDHHGEIRRNLYVALLDNEYSLSKAF